VSAESGSPRRPGFGVRGVRRCGCWGDRGGRTNSSAPSKARQDLTATVRVEQEVTIVEVSGRIVGGEEASLLRDRIKWLLHSTTNVILNLSGITFIDSAGLGMLVSMWTSSKSGGRAIKFASVRGKVKQLLDTTRLNTIFEIYDDVDQAIRNVAKKK
jgi:anti-sigma B factor antagonist